MAGASKPLQMPLPPDFTWMPTLLGHEGVGILEGAELVSDTDPDATSDDAAYYIIDQAASQPGEISLVTIGPLTNVGRALQLEPRLADWLSDVTLMGGTVYVEGFSLPLFLETNLNADPEAARLVFASGLPLAVVPMEVTTQVFLSPEQRQDMLSWGSEVAETLVILMENMYMGLGPVMAEIGLGQDFYQGRIFMHDPLAVYTTFAEQYVTLREMHIALEVIDEVLRTIPYHDRKPNCRVCVEVDASSFVRFWMERIHSLQS